MSSKLYDRIQVQISAISDEIALAKADGSFSFTDGLAVATHGAGRFMGLAAGLGDMEDDVEEAILSGVEQLFDRVIVPLNLPWIPEFAERIVEGGVRDQIRPQLKPMLAGFIAGFKAGRDGK